MKTTIKTIQDEIIEEKRQALIYDLAAAGYKEATARVYWDPESHERIKGRKAYIASIYYDNEVFTAIVIFIKRKKVHLLRISKKREPGWYNMGWWGWCDQWAEHVQIDRNFMPDAVAIFSFDGIRKRFLNDDEEERDI